LRKFQFRLSSLLRYRESRRDLCRQLLAEVLADDRALADLGERILHDRSSQLEEMRSLGEAGRVNVDGSAARRYFAGQLTIEHRQVVRRRELVAKQIEMCRAALVQADRDVKVLEKMKDNQRAEFALEQDRAATRELGETWQSARLSLARGER
jgi:flagellar FliJ protein